MFNQPTSKILFATITSLALLASASALAEPICINTECSAIPKADMQSLKAAIPDLESIEALKKMGENRSYKLGAKNEKSYFAKFFIDEHRQFFKARNYDVENFAAIHEAAASQLGSYITNELVPKGVPLIGSGILFPYTEIDEKATKELFGESWPRNYEYVDIYDRLTRQQKTQLFIHMIADLILDNTDAHAGQFAISKDQNLIGFDKGRAYWRRIFEDQTVSKFELSESLLAKGKIYRDFVKRLKADPAELKKLLSSEKVQSSLRLIESILNQRQDLLTIMSPMFTFLNYSEKDKEKLESIKNSYLQGFAELKPFIKRLFALNDRDFRAETDHKTILNYEVISGLHSLEFRPETFHPKLIAPIEVNSPGDLVSNMVDRAGALAGINAGFFSYGSMEQWSFSWIANKALQKAGAQTSAFPSAILKTERGLFGDASEYYPSLGWKSDGSAYAMGQLRVQWVAETSSEQSAFHLIRANTPLNPKIPEQHLYIPKGGNHYLRISILKKKVNELLDVTVSDSDSFDNLVNSFKLKNTERDRRHFDSAKVGDKIHISYTWDEKEVTSSNGGGFLGMDHVISGGNILIQNFHIDTNFPSPYRDQGGSNSRTTVCIKANGAWSFFIGSGTLLEIASTLKNQGCKDAINFDGGASPSMYFSDKKERILNNRFVSDAIVVMPMELKSLRSLIYGDSTLFALLQEQDEQKVREYVTKRPSAVSDRNINKQNLLQVIFANHQGIELDSNLESIAQFLFEHMSRDDLIMTDTYGETALHSALRNEHFNFVNKIVDHLEFGDLGIRGINGQTPLDLFQENALFPDSTALYEKALSSPWSEASIDYLSQTLAPNGDHRNLALRSAELLSEASEQKRALAFRIMPALLYNSPTDAHQIFEICDRALAKGLNDASELVASAALSAIDRIYFKSWKSIHPVAIEEALTLKVFDLGSNVLPAFERLIISRPALPAIETSALRDSEQLTFQPFAIGGMLWKYNRSSVIIELVEHIISDIKQKSPDERMAKRYLDFIKLLPPSIKNDPKITEILLTLIEVVDDFQFAEIFLSSRLENGSLDEKEKCVQIFIRMLSNKSFQWTWENVGSMRKVIPLMAQAIEDGTELELVSQFAFAWKKTMISPQNGHQRDFHSNYFADILYRSILKRPEGLNILEAQTEETLKGDALARDSAAVKLVVFLIRQNHFSLAERLVDEHRNGATVLSRASFEHCLKTLVENKREIDLGRQRVLQVAKDTDAISFDDLYSIVTLTLALAQASDDNLSFALHIIPTLLAKPMTDYTHYDPRQFMGAIGYSKIYQSEQGLKELAKLLNNTEVGESRTGIYWQDYALNYGLGSAQSRKLVADSSVEKLENSVPGSGALELLLHYISFVNYYGDDVKGDFKSSHDFFKMALIREARDGFLKAKLFEDFRFIKSFFPNQGDDLTRAIQAEVTEIELALSEAFPGSLSGYAIVRTLLPFAIKAQVRPETLTRIVEALAKLRIYTLLKLKEEYGPAKFNSLVSTGRILKKVESRMKWLKSENGADKVESLLKEIRDEGGFTFWSIHG